MKRLAMLFAVTLVMSAAFAVPTFAQQGKLDADQPRLSTPPAGSTGMTDTTRTDTGYTGRSSFGNDTRDKMARADHFRASDLLGKDLKSDNGQKLGEISDLVVGSDGRLNYAVVSRGGMMGVGDRLIPVPWNAIHTGSKDDGFMINIDEKKFSSAPSFTKDEWGKLADPRWEKDVYGYYGEPSRSGF